MPVVRSVAETVLENFAGDLEYHPRGAAVYLGLGAAAAGFWIFSPPDTKFTSTPLVFALGSLTLILKGAFLLRKSSEGIGLSEQEVSELSKRSGRKELPSLPYHAAQIMQDFGAGAFLLWPLLRYGKGLDESWDNAPILRVFVTGAVLFGLGWLIRRLTIPYMERLQRLRSQLQNSRLLGMWPARESRFPLIPFLGRDLHWERVNDAQWGGCP